MEAVKHSGLNNILQNMRQDVLWSDEIKAELILIYVLRKSTTICHTKNIVSTVEHGGGNIILCGNFNKGL